jgi:glycosyltransferase involved in cell wall biosynthesis
VTYRVGFLMDQVAGHITNYRNIRRVVERDPEVEPAFMEVSYYRPAGRIERVSKLLRPLVPTYVSGNLRAYVDARRALGRRRFDAVLTNAPVAIFFPKFFEHTPTVVDFDSTPRQVDAMKEYTSIADPGPLAYLKWRLKRNLWMSADRLQAWSHWARDSAIRDYGMPAGKVIVNPPGVDLTFWRPGPSKQQDSPLRMLFVGGDFRRKGGPLLLDWFNCQPPGRAQLHIVTKENVASGRGVHVYHDMEPNSKRLLQLYHDADVFVLPSAAECFGIATVEAMAAGLPVVVTDSGGTADIVDHGSNGFIVPVGDVRALFSALEMILDDGPLRARMAQRSRQLAEARFDVETNASRTIALLKEIADAKPRREEPRSPD